jgi:hypothetical protein
MHGTVSWGLEETLMKLRQLYCDPRLLKRELAAGVLGSDLDIGKALTGQGVEDLSKQPG